MVHDKEYIRRISSEELSVLVKRGKGVIKVMTVAPEVVNRSHVQMMKDSGMVVSAGHTNATYEQARDFFDWGGSAVTHLFNAMSQLQGREPGVVGAAYDSKNVWAGIIVDGLHVHFSSVSISKKVKGRRLVLVTDAMPPVGTRLSSFNLGKLEVLCTNGKCTTKDGTLAGSALDMATAVRNCVQKVGIPLDEALRMASKCILPNCWGWTTYWAG